MAEESKSSTELKTESKAVASKKNKKEKVSLLKTLVSLIELNDLASLEEKLPILEQRIDELEQFGEQITNTGKRNLRQYKKYKKLIESGDIQGVGVKTDETIAWKSKKSNKKKRYVLFVGNLSYDTTEDGVRAHFKKVGEIVSIRMGRHANNESRGFCHLELANQLSYENALLKHHSFLDRRRINVVYSGNVSTMTSESRDKLFAKESKLRYLQKNGLLQCQWNGKPMKRKFKAKNNKN